MIDLHTVNKLMITGEITKPAPSPWPSTSLWWEQIRMAALFTAHRQFAITSEGMFQYQ